MADDLFIILIIVTLPITAPIALIWKYLIHPAIIRFESDGRKLNRKLAAERREFEHEKTKRYFALKYLNNDISYADQLGTDWKLYLDYHYRARYHNEFPHAPYRLDDYGLISRFTDDSDEVHYKLWKPS